MAYCALRAICVKFNRMENTLIIFTHILGLVGMAGVGIIPVRVWQLLVLRRIGFPLLRNNLSIFLSLLVLTTLALSVYVALHALPRVFLCLWQGLCTATQGGSLFGLALFGITVLVVEITWLVSKTILRSS